MSKKWKKEWDDLYDRWMVYRSDVVPQIRELEIEFHAGSMADVDLVLSAPELLAILEDIVNDDMSDLRKSLWKRAVDVIAKARGNQDY